MKIKEILNLGLSKRNIDRMDATNEYCREKLEARAKARYAANAGKRVYTLSGQELIEFHKTDQGVFFKASGKTGTHTEKVSSVLGVMETEVDYDRPIHYTWPETLTRIVFIEEPDLRELSSPALTNR